MISPREIAELRERLLALDQIAAAATGTRVRWIRNGYLRQLRLGLAEVAARTRELEVAAWDD